MINTPDYRGNSHQQMSVIEYLNFNIGNDFIAASFNGSQPFQLGCKIVVESDSPSLFDICNIKPKKTDQLLNKVAP